MSQVGNLILISGPNLERLI